MTRADARKAIDEACADGLKNLFRVLEQTAGTPEFQVALGRFETGFTNHLITHAAAAASIEKLIGE